MKKTLLLLSLFLLSFSSLPYPSSQEVQKVTLLRDQTWIIEISTSEILHLQQVKEMKQSSYQYERKKKKDFYPGQMIIVYKDTQSQLPVEVLSSSAIYKVLNTNDGKN
jgi:hypothetical protein